MRESRTFHQQSADTGNTAQFLNQASVVREIIRIKTEKDFYNFPDERLWELMTSNCVQWWPELPPQQSTDTGVHWRHWSWSAGLTRLSLNYATQHQQLFSSTLNDQWEFQLSTRHISALLDLRSESLWEKWHHGEIRTAVSAGSTWYFSITLPIILPTTRQYWHHAVHRRRLERTRRGLGQVWGWMGNKKGWIN